MIKHYSQNIQNVIQRELFAAKKSIKICVAWFTNDLLFQPLILKLNMGVKVELILNKDEINLSDSNDVDFDQFVANGGCLYWNTTDKLLHHKFCIIDDRVVITGSYNWTNKAEYNYEDITVCTEDSEYINHYQKIFEKLSQEFPLLKSNQTSQKKKNTTSNQEQTYTCSIKYTTTDGKIIDISCDELSDGVKIISNIYRNGLGEIIFNKEITFIGCIFSRKETLQSITIPDSVTTIQYGAFEGCSSLTSITIPDSVTEIENLAFFGCSCLIGVNIKISNLAKYCAGNCMHNIQGSHHLFIGETEVKRLTIPNNVTEIGEWAFLNCISLTSISIPDGVTSIGGAAFTRCSSLTSITIPDSVTSIGGAAFMRCSSLTSITIPDGVNEIGDNAFVGCKSLVSMSIPDSVTVIGRRAFSGCSGLTSIIIGNGVREIGSEAFRDCSNLTSITIPDGVTEIGYGAFRYCSSLTSVTIGNSVTVIKDGVFSGCDCLKSFDGKFAEDDGRCLIVDGRLVAFALNCGLAEYTIPSIVTSIGDYAFRGSKILTRLYVPKNVKSIGKYALCESLKNVIFESSIPPSIVYGFV